MPAGRPARKRKRPQDDPLASDPNDSDYHSAEPHTARKKAVVSKKRKTTAGKGKKRKANNYKYDDEDDLSMGGTEESFGDDDVKDEPTEIGPTGRPLRQSRKSKAVNYDETEDVEAEEEFVQVDDDDVGMSQDGEEDEPEEEQRVTIKGRRTKKGGEESGKPRFMIKLKVPQVPEVPQAQPRRSTRATSATAQSRPITGGKAPAKGPMKAAGRGGSAGPPPVGYGLMTRRSSRLGHTDEPLTQLTTSGKHVEIIKGTGPEVILEEGESSLESSGGAGATGAGGEQIVEAPGTQGGRSARADITQSDAQAVSHDDDEGFVNVDQDVDDGHEADEDEDEQPSKRIRNRIVVSTSRRGSTASPRTTRSGGVSKDPTASPSAKRAATGGKRPVHPRIATRGTSRKAGESDEDEYQEDEDGEESADDSMSNASSPPKSRGPPELLEDEDDEYPDANTRARKGKGKRPLTSASQHGVPKRRRVSSDEVSQAEQLEIAEELEDLRPSPKRLRQRTQRRPAASSGEGEAAPDRTLRRRTQHVDYRILRPENAMLLEEGDGGVSTPSRRRNGAAGVPRRSLFDTSGPFGGGGPSALFGRGGRGGFGAPAGDLDSDSSDDDRMQRPGTYSGLGGVGMTPTSAAAPGLLAPVGQTHNLDPLQGTPAGLGKVTKAGKQSLADSDPLGIDTNIDFSSVGGLDDKIQQLKEMVQLPLTYPEIFQAKNITPPRGVLFYGPPGTGKTLMARALAASCSTESRKVTFYMRKGADCLSKWVGEAERQLRLLFEEAKSNQPSIIFFDEIDGLAPVRSSKQDQIHASIVSTLLALMDGMDGRGQVVVIGATNRPDAVDPALRRPGRFDREFYFPLPALEARRQILDIHTKGWQPPLSDAFKDQLAELSKGYGGADLRALCTEAALNAVQRTYPQIYMTTDKLQLDPKKIEVTARDFMASMKQIVPSSERSSASGASPLPKHVEPLLSAQLELIKESLKGILPERKRMTILEEALYEDDIGADGGFERERMMQDFENSRVFRPRLLIHGPRGMGQQYIGAGVLHHFEKLHVQSFDLATLLSDSTRSPEAAIVQLFVEVKRRKPSVIYIPDVDIWYRSIPEQALVTFKGLLHGTPSNDPVLVLGITSTEAKDLDPIMLRDLFGYSRKDKFELTRPGKDARLKYFDKLMSHIRKSPDDFPPDPATRQKRELEVLPVVAPPPPRPLSKAERKAQAQKDRQIKNWLKMRLNNLMELIKQKYRRFKKPVLEYEQIKHLIEPPSHDGDLVTPDIPQLDTESYRFQLAQSDDLHVPLKFLDTVTNKTYHNIDIDIIEERFSNGHYCTPKQFLQDLEYIKEDAITIGDKDRKIKANEMLTNAEVFIADVEMDAAFIAQCEEMYQREKKKLKGLAEKIERKKKAAEEAMVEADKVAESVDRQERRSPSKQVERESTAPVAAGSVSTSNGVKEPGASPGEQPRAAIGAHSPPSNGQQTQSSEHPSAFQTPYSRLHSNFSLESGSRPGATSGGESQVPQMTSQQGASLGVTPVGNLSGVLNYASTTTSGKRTSDGTGVNSQPFSNPYSNSNGTSSMQSRPMNPPAFHWGGISTGDSQLPDTQVVPSSSEGSGHQSSQSLPPSQPLPFYSQPSQGSQPFLPPPLPHPHPDRSYGPFFQLPPLQVPSKIVDEGLLAAMQNRLCEETSGYSVEQLEQVNSAMMSRIWQMRTNWNRTEVAKAVMEVFEEIEGEVREIQGVMDASGSFSN